MTPVVTPNQVRSVPDGLPPFPRLLPNAAALNSLAAAILLVTRQVWPALGIFAGFFIGVALFWSLHLISRALVEQYVEAEAERKEAQLYGPKAQANVRRMALWRLAGMLALKYVSLAVIMAGGYHLVKDHLIPFLLAFLGAFALTQLSIVSAASRSMRAAK